MSDNNLQVAYNQLEQQFNDFKLRANETEEMLDMDLQDRKDEIKKL